MIVTAWNNGAHWPNGAGYGIKVKAHDRDRFFIKEWSTITLELEGSPMPIVVNIKKTSFWGNTCRELIHKGIGQWLLENRLAPWPRGRPRNLTMEYISDNRFSIRRANS